MQGVQLPCAPLVVGQPPKVRRLAVVPYSVPTTAAAAAIAFTSVPAMERESTAAVAALSPVEAATRDCGAACETLLALWVAQQGRQLHAAYGADELLVGTGSAQGSSSRGAVPELGTCALQCLGRIVLEQQRLLHQFVHEVVAALRAQVQAHLQAQFAQSQCDLTQTQKQQLQLQDVLSPIHARYGATAMWELLQKQQLDLQGARAADFVCNGCSSNAGDIWGTASAAAPTALRVRCGREAVFEEATTLQNNVHDVLRRSLRAAVI
jgi:hypothetical protein